MHIFCTTVSPHLPSPSLVPLGARAHGVIHRGASNLFINIARRLDPIDGNLKLPRSQRQSVHFTSPVLVSFWRGSPVFGSVSFALVKVSSPHLTEKRRKIGVGGTSHFPWYMKSTNLHQKRNHLQQRSYLGQTAMTMSQDALFMFDCPSHFRPHTVAFEHLQG